MQDLKLVGQSVPRYDIPAKVDGSFEWAVDVNLPGMVHARNVRPPFAGATLTGVDESSVRGLPGFLRVVREGNYVAVVCEREEQAIEAAETLAVTWEKPATAPFPASDDLFDYLRSAAPEPNPGGRWAPEVEGDPDRALAGAATVVEAAYDVPFQGHTAIGPAHALADPSDGQMTIYTNDMKPYSHRTGIAEFLGMPPERVRVIWMEGPQLYGRTAADDAGFEAAYLAKELGRPVRMQWMRHEETAWDTKGPAFAIDLRADSMRTATWLRWTIRPDRQLRARRLQPGPDGAHRATDGPPPGAAGARGAGGPDAMYHVPNRREETRAVRLPLVFETPLRTGNLRDPNGPQITSPPSRSWTSWRRPRTRTRSSSGCASCGRGGRRRGLPPGALDRGGRSGRQGLRLGRPAVTREGGQRTPSHRTRHRLRLPRPHHRRGDRRSRGGPRDRAVRVPRMVCAHDCGLVINRTASRTPSRGTSCTASAGPSSRRSGSTPRRSRASTGVRIRPSPTGTHPSASTSWS